jgi:tRNA-Thr(GGU) m(6)t(6)A37 methyltransferase TsaA
MQINITRFLSMEIISLHFYYTKKPVKQETHVSSSTPHISSKASGDARAILGSKDILRHQEVCMKLSLTEIGKISAGTSFAVELDAEYAAGLAGLKGFSHIMIVWYANKAPKWSGESLVITKPYRLAPDKLGVFATRTPVRPNPICVSVAAVSSIDEKKGIVNLWWTDAEDGTPVLDIKPYHPSSEIARDSKRPSWCAKWPSCLEDSASFAWDKEFLF